MKLRSILFGIICIISIGMIVSPLHNGTCIDPPPDWVGYEPEIDFEYDDHQIITSNSISVNWTWFTENRIGNGSIFDISITILNSYQLEPQLIYNYSDFINIYETIDSIEINLTEISDIYTNQSFLLIIEYYIYIDYIHSNVNGNANLTLYWNPDITITSTIPEMFQLPFPWYVFVLIFGIGGIVVGYGLYWIYSCKNIDNALEPKCHINKKLRPLPNIESKSNEKKKINIVLQKRLFKEK